MENEISIAKTLTEEAYLATTFLSGVNIARYGSLLNDLQKAFCVGRDEYLKTLISSYDLEINQKGDTKGICVPPNDDAAFATKSEEANVSATDWVK